MDLVARYPRVIVAASYAALLFGALALGMRLEAAAAGAGTAWLPIGINLATILLGMFVLHYAYTVGWQRHVDRDREGRDPSD